MIRLATRKSPLALWQTEYVADELRRHYPETSIELLPLSTRGDEVLDRSLSEIGGKGVFLKELERALLENEADIAVHSLKDVPAESPPGLKLSVVMPRGDWADWWLTADGRTPDELPSGARVGTSSLRRQSQLIRQYPDLDVVPIRGSVQTRMGLMTSGQVDAVILAAAGLQRLAFPLEHRLALGPPAFIPSPGQGVIVTQCRADDEHTQQLLAPLGCPDTADQVAAERAVVATLGGDCRMPLAALAQIDGKGRLTLHARLCSPDGRLAVERVVEGDRQDAEALGLEAGESILEHGGREIIAALPA
ncbi:hydroxymethylbilane synthase [Wenzhouxiangella limi]|uniref:Porphobilinogen deaminase n=1 Tax=Wenzhouxiangella limi TaxID=2707351 RepID=A0A845V379_9GAMM|nr:hydroxymethylbilane synthase [Wenzhouxiangella limi]NDY94455.1 hydroxymethylbilane synthase [Wenzhouxiangella limi]